MSRNTNETNLRLAGLFVLLVCGLIILSLLLKVLFVFRDSKFDGSHSFVVGFIGQSQTKLVDFNPQGATLSIINVSGVSDKNSLERTLGIPVDGVVEVRQNIQDKDISQTLLKSASPFSSSLEGLTFIDALRLSVFAKTVQAGAIYDRDFPPSLNDSQKATVLSLSFTDPTVYQENQAIQIINASNVSGVGSRLAALLTNIGGSPILVTTADNPQTASKIIYYQQESYTVRKLSSYLNFPAEKSDKKGIADVTIIIGTDKVDKRNF